ncbi:MAG: MoxR family ATPase [Haliscomenobacteraceae bacterium CHB4]|nr:hypothetical protein [Saprospiraceae bacterium]MCE7924323.1 MoxR family ATPase [Haliscomenobacteraceae bacterium CHB4]
MSNFHHYQPAGQAELPTIAINKKLHDPRLYVPSPGLTSAVNVALNLGLPLLLTGEPGTGKTELAQHIAHFFNLGKPLVFNAQTTSVAKDLFYRYDALGHFQYSQTQKATLTPDDIEVKFIRYQALGDAIRLDRRAVVLLDEIDKAPRDLPNDVLAALEDLRFEVPEIGKHYAASPGNRPIIVMTSNSEKNLPDAFLRRVVYYHIPFPDAATLLHIVSAKVEGYGEKDIQAIIAHFEDIRRRKLRKNPATAELIQWAALLRRMEFPAHKLEHPDKLSAQEREVLRISYSVLAKSKEDLNMLHQ